jgi:hypothetical protein
VSPFAWIAMAAAAIGGLAGARLRLRNWGALPIERSLALPGDELIPEPADAITRGVSIEAPPSEVWQWLVQIGQDRGGMYSYDWLENLLGLRIHSAREIRDDWQDLQAGDRITLVRPGWLGLKKGYSLPVERIDQGRAIVLLQAPPEHPWEAVWSFHVLSAGPERCRLISRSREAIKPGVGPAIGRIVGQAMDPITLLMTRKMLLTIKKRAEGNWRPRVAHGISERV